MSDRLQPVDRRLVDYAGPAMPSAEHIGSGWLLPVHRRRISGFGQGEFFSTQHFVCSIPTEIHRMREDIWGIAFQ